MTAVTNSRRARAWAILVTAVLLLVALPTPGARAAEAAGAYTVEARVLPDGMIEARATIELEGAPGTLVQRFATTQRALDDRLYRYAIDVTGVTADGVAVNPTITNEPGYVQLGVPTEGVRSVELAYRVRGAALASSDDTTTVSWRFLQGLNLPVRTFTATVSTPGLFTSLDCRSGAPGDPGVCADFSGGTHEQSDPYVHDGPRGAGEIVQVVLRFPDATVAANEDVVQLWSLDRAFSTAPVPLGAAALAALLAGLAFWALHRRYGRDAATTTDPRPVAEFHPVGPGSSEFRVLDDVRPGQVGTLVDERVDPLDVTATLLDLAVRGDLRITELPHRSTFALGDWVITRGEGSPAPLRPYERPLVDALAGPDGAGTRVSALAPAVASVIDRVQAELYDEVAGHGWFARRPDQTRAFWTRVGWVGLAVASLAAVLLIALTSFGLLALVLVAIAVGIGFVGQAMPARTAKGSGVLAGLGVLRGQLLAQRTDQAPPGRELAELSKVLPFAVVLGGVDRWLDAVAASDADDEADGTDLGWYHAPDDWHLADLPDSLRAFLSRVEAELFQR